MRLFISKSAPLVALGAFAITAITPPASAGLIAQDLFEYESGPLNSSDAGGLGWTGGWSTNTGAGIEEVVTPGLTRTPAPDTSASTNATKFAGVGGSSAESFRTLSTTLQASSDPDSTFWISFLGQRLDNNTIRSTFLSLRSGATEEALIGQFTDGNGNWGVNAPGSNPLTTSVAMSDLAFLVAKLEFDINVDGDDRITLFVNPSASDPTINDGSAAIITSIVSVDNIRLFAGGTQTQGSITRDPVSATFDDIRVGNDYADVVPEPASLAMLGLVGLCLICRLHG